MFTVSVMGSDCMQGGVSIGLFGSVATLHFPLSPSPPEGNCFTVQIDGFEHMTNVKTITCMLLFIVVVFYKSPARCVCLHHMYVLQNRDSRPTKDSLLFLSQIISLLFQSDKGFFTTPLT